jgi:hypothetical protein
MIPAALCLLLGSVAGAWLRRAAHALRLPLRWGDQ